MIHTLTSAIVTRRVPLVRLVVAACACSTLAACAGAAEDYPSFAIPSASGQPGRVAVSFPGVAAPEPITGDPLADSASDSLVGEPEARIAAITNRAARATAAFAGAVPAARMLANAARGAAPSSYRWAEAQVSLADLSAHHSEGQLTLAQLDQLAEALLREDKAEAALLAEVATAQARLASVLDEQGAQLTAISALLDR